MQEFSKILDKELNKQEFDRSKQEILGYDTSSPETINSLVTKKYLDSLEKIEEGMSDVFNKAAKKKYDDFVKDSDT